MSKDSNPTFKRRRSLGQEVTLHLRKQVVRSDLKPGHRLVEEGLARELGISRTPVREALHRLEQEGVLTKRPRGGYEVRPLTSEEVADALGVRSVLEGYCAELASRQAPPGTIEKLEENTIGFERALAEENEKDLLEHNSQFHVLLYQAAGSPLLLRMLGELQEIVERISRAIISNMEAGLWSTQDHREILEAIKAGQGAKAAKLARQHVEHGAQWIVSRMIDEKLEL
ncbi:MAG: GntR family transcriptional regulator [Desulfarculaceae bacterium]|nr:GntR family transcriptional regulator [Desulfarculaceae bacterium]MCF8072375.1 GntR family transcriptional regulator [Desulfarculaceae bacterium]MCF8100296.1 GntR family transcriptional regulator [Desulfarculaceae bacterium]MCF8116131.1 GntR family transcriptional regulator [Desulfarculaceae bacterium]